MEWLSQNWVWVLLGIGFAAMHMFGHGGHGGHGGHEGYGSGAPHEDDKPAGKDGNQRTSKQGSGHQH